MCGSIVCMCDVWLIQNANQLSKHRHNTGIGWFGTKIIETPFDFHEINMRKRMRVWLFFFFFFVFVHILMFVYINLVIHALRNTLKIPLLTVVYFFGTRTSHCALCPWVPFSIKKNLFRCNCKQQSTVVLHETSTARNKISAAFNSFPPPKHQTATPRAATQWRAIMMWFKNIHSLALESKC